MGRDWLYWVATRRRRMSAETKEAEEEGGAATSSGCMCSVFQLFDLHHFQLQSFHPANTFLQQEAIPSKGVEAPRNSLELQEETPTIAIKEQEQSLNLPVGIQIKTRISTSAQESKTEDPVPEAKTPNLVARLMGLDLLPDCSSPSYSSSDSKPQTKSHYSSQRNRSRKYFSDDDISIGAHSLPETPIISSARRSDSEYRSHSVRRLRQDENTSPGHYAKQIVKQVKESVSRRVGLADITNRAETEETIRRDQNLVLLKPANGEIVPSSSPKLRFLDIKKNKTAAVTTKSPRTSTSSDSNHQSQEKHQQTILIPQQCQHKNVETRKGSSSSVKKLTPPQNWNKKEEPFVHSSPKNRANFTDKKKNKNKKATLSSETTLNISGPILVPVKKGPSPPPTTLPQKQAQVSSDALSSKRNTQLSSNTSHSYKHLHLQPNHKIPTVLPDKTNGCSTAAAAAAEYKPYIDKILKRAGINDKLAPITLGKWHTPSHPLDPSIYYYLELFHPSAAAGGGLSRRCNRKLIFQLVDEILAEILRAHLDFKPWASPVSRIDDQFGVIDGICRKIEGYPAANCEVLEDIDCLIESDLREWRLDGFFEVEGEGLVCEIEGEILGMLVRETVAMVGDRTTEEGRRQGRVMSRGGGLLVT